MLRTKMVDLERNRLVSITAITNILLVNQKKKTEIHFVSKENMEISTKFRAMVLRDLHSYRLRSGVAQYFSVQGLQADYNFRWNRAMPSAAPAGAASSLQ